MHGQTTLSSLQVSSFFVTRNKIQINNPKNVFLNGITCIKHSTVFLTCHTLQEEHPPAVGRRRYVQNVYLQTKTSHFNPTINPALQYTVFWTSSSVNFKFFLWRSTPNRAYATSLTFLDHTDTLRNKPITFLWINYRLVTEAAAYAIYNKYMRWIFILSAGFEPALPVFEWPQVYILAGTSKRIDEF